MGWLPLGLPLVRSFKLKVSFAKEPCEGETILCKRDLSLSCKEVYVLQESESAQRLLVNKKVRIVVL